MKAQDILTELQSLDAQNPGAWPLYARIGAAVLLGVVILVGGTYVLIKPLREALIAEEAKEGDLRTKFENNQRKAAALELYKEQLAEMERNFGAMLKQLPSKSEVANLLNDISQTRVASSLEEELFQPVGEMPKEFYAEIPNRIVVTGSYHEMGNFVSSVAALPRIVTIDEVDIRPVGKGDELRMQALAKTYRYLDEDATATEPGNP
jgi:type IV pilus assembly protein PilO